MTNDSIKVQVAQINEKLNGLITLQAIDSESIKRKLNDDRKYLEGEVHRALNFHSEIKDEITLVKLKINELERREYKCPIDIVLKDVETLKSETAESRAKYKYPEIRQGMTMWAVVKYVAIIIVAGAAVISLILNIKSL